jgi:hypothetical protein
MGWCIILTKLYGVRKIFHFVWGAYGMHKIVRGTLKHK